MNVTTIQPPKPTKAKLTLNVELTVKDMAMLNKFLLLNQHFKNTHGPMTFDKLATMWLQDVAAAVRDNTTRQGGHAALVLSEHGYRT
jgi:hypothetical protein